MKNQLKFFCFSVAGLLLLCMFVVWFFDPFYQYHMPFFGLKPVLYERETQMPGSIRHFSYDSLLVGSSVVENCDSTYLDDKLGTKTLKIVKGSGSAPDLLYYVDMAQRERDITHVFYGLDLFSLMNTTEVTVVSEYSPNYLFTSTPFDDFSYLFNKDILFKKIPLSIIYSLQGKYCDGKAYYWADGKTFSKEQAMSTYQRPEIKKPQVDFSDKKEIISANVQKLEAMVKEHPNTRYVFFLPPYSLLYWDEVIRVGEKNQYAYALEMVLCTLADEKNVEIYSFLMDRDIILDLNFYMDTVHFSTQINQYMLQCMVENYRITEENLDVILKDFSETCDFIEKEGIYQYYDDE